jgi:hypothetical protein
LMCVNAFVTIQNSPCNQFIRKKRSKENSLVFTFVPAG